MFEQKLNSSWGFCLGVAFGLLGVWLDYKYYEDYMKPNDPSFLTVLCAFLHPESHVTVHIVTLLIVFFAGVILGLAAWRVIVIGWCVRLLTEWFDLDPKFGHPDGCGGLSPLGDICLLNALMIGIISSSFGLSIIAIETTWLRWYYDFLLNYLISILSISFAISIVAFLWPVWNVHEIMKNKKYKILKKLNSIGREIEKEQRNMFEDDVVINPDILKLKITKLETLKKAYEINSQLREWPFDSNTVKTFLSSIIIPIMSLTGLGEWLINIVHELLL
jgi:MFS family permease